MPPDLSFDWLQISGLSLNYNIIKINIWYENKKDINHILLKTSFVF